MKIDLKTPSAVATIYIGDDVIATRLPYLLQGQKNFVLTDENVYSLHRAFFEKWMQGETVCVLPAGEAYKNFSSLQTVLEKMVGAGLKRTSKLFAVGGGVIGDLGGLCAALYMRGIECVQIPTTLLAMVDSSVGGKTAIDVGGVKNVVGAFHQPKEVLIDPMFLGTLPGREWKCGIGEIDHLLFIEYPAGVIHFAFTGNKGFMLCRSMSQTVIFRDHLQYFIVQCVYFIHERPRFSARSRYSSSCSPVTTRFS